MEPGKLTSRVTFRSRSTSTVNGVRRDDYTNVEPGRLPAAIETPFASRVSRLFGDRDVATIAHIVTVRAGIRVRPKDALVWHTADGDIQLQISGIQTIEAPQGKFLVIAVTEVM